ncbi:hypothetical protein [Bradyrhizobium sp. McL0616]|uniref:hypothetical protein n=1 Tax=Bradyrhizobium sp. McL0616 TaxID=3415674 RepID=UPI003CED18DE
MPARLKRNKRRHSTQITPEAIAIFRQGLDTSDLYELRDIKIRLAAALGRSKFRACPLDSEPRSLIGCDTEPVEAVLELRTRLLEERGRDATTSADGPGRFQDSTPFA